MYGIRFSGNIVLQLVLYVVGSVLCCQPRFVYMYIISTFLSVSVCVYLCVLCVRVFVEILCFSAVLLSFVSSALVVCLVLSVWRRQLSDFAPLLSSLLLLFIFAVISGHLCNLRAAKVGKLSRPHCLPNQI